MLINVKHGKLKLVFAALSKISEIVEIHEVYGRFDIVARVEVESKEELKKFIQNKLQITEGIHRTETLMLYSAEPEEELSEEEPDD